MIMRTIRPEDLGDMGESFFKTLCKNASLVANSSKSDDKGGWDFEVEHRGKGQIEYSNQSYPVYRVQVKSTVCNNETRLTYSNLLKLIRYSGPSFIVLIRYSSSIYPDDAFILHIDEAFSLSVLKEIRWKQLTMRRFALNSNEKTIRFGSESRIHPLDGKGLEETFKKHVMSDYLHYVRNKLDYLSRFEKEGKQRQFTVTVKSKEDITAMANCFLGYEQKFKIDIKEYPAPFGMKDKEPTLISTDSETTVSPQHDKMPQTQVCLRTSRYGKEYKFNGKSYAVPLQIPSAIARKVRTKCRLFDFIYDHNAQVVSIQTRDFLSEDIEVSFKELYDYLCFENDTASTDEIYIRLVDVESKKSFELPFESPCSKRSEQFESTFELVSLIYIRLRDLNLEDRIISTKKFFANFSQLELLRIIDREYKPSMAMQFESKEGGGINANVVIFASSIRLKDTTLVVFVAFYGAVYVLGQGTYLGAFDRSESLGDCIIKSGEALEEAIKSESERYKGTLQENGFEVIYGT